MERVNTHKLYRKKCIEYLLHSVAVFFVGFRIFLSALHLQQSHLLGSAVVCNACSVHVLAPF